MINYLSKRISLKRDLRHFALCDKGTQLVEFAIALPFLVLMFAGSIELGRLLYTYTTLTKATVVGARYLSSPPTPSGSSGYAAADVTAAKNLMICGVASSCSGVTPVVPGFAVGQITITPPPTSGATRYVTVTVSYAYTPKVFNLGTMTGVSALSLNYTLTPTTTMRYMLDSQ